MSAEQWYAVLSKAHRHGFRVLEIGGRGEPTLNPVFTRVVTLAHQLGYRVELLSNALQDKPIIEILPYLSKLTINLNAIDAQAMQAIHQPAPGFTFERSLGLVKSVLSAIAIQQLKIDLQTNYVVTKQSLRAAFTFPEQVNRLLADTGIEDDIHINYQHVHNYIKTPQYLGFDFAGLQKVLIMARLNSRNPYLIKKTNLLEFIKKTEQLIERLKPFLATPGLDHPTCFTCKVYEYVMFIDGNGDSFGCYNPFRMVNGLSIDKDPFYFGNLLKQSFEEVFAGRNGFDPLIDVSKAYWRPCLLCKAEERAMQH